MRRGGRDHRSGEILANLERSNLFTSVDPTGEWYQLHHLFAEALRLELVRTRPGWSADCISGPPVVRGRRRPGEATAHAIASHDLGLATRLVTVQAQSST